MNGGTEVNGDGGGGHVVGLGVIQEGPSDHGGKVRPSWRRPATLRGRQILVRKHSKVLPQILAPIGL